MLDVYLPGVFLTIEGMVSGMKIDFESCHITPNSLVIKKYSDTFKELEN
jgi:hypothetical protein